MDPSDVAGVVSAAHWHSALSAIGMLPALTQSDGVATTANLTWTSPPSITKTGVWRLDFTGKDGDSKMMNGYLDPFDSPAEVVVTDLSPSIARGYDVYVYVMGDVSTSDQTRTYNYTIGATTLVVSQTGPTPTVFDGYHLVTSNGGPGNYVVFHRVSGSTSA